MTAIGTEIQNRCEAIKQNYTSIFDDRSNHFWVVVPLTILAAATAQTSLVPLLFIAGMFFLGLLTSSGGSGNSSYEECDYDNPRLNFLISRFESEAASNRENIYRRSLLRLYDDTELELIRNSTLGESDIFSSYRPACNLGGTQHTCNAFVVVIHRSAAYVELQGRDSIKADLDWLIVLDPHITSVSLGWDNPVTAAAAAMTPMSSMLRLALRAIVHAEADEKMCSDWLAGDTKELQTWAQQYVPYYLFWVNGASICEAAAIMATLRETPYTDKEKPGPRITTKRSTEDQLKPVPLNCRRISRSVTR